MPSTVFIFRRGTRPPRSTFRRSQAGAVRAAAIAGVGAVGLLTVGGALGYRYLTVRPGEAASDRFLPADSAFVAMLDLKPSSPEQAGVFARLADALRRSGLDREATDAAEQATGRSSVARDVLPYLTGGAALAAKGDQTGDDAVALLAIRDASAVGQILARRAIGSEKAPDGFTIVAIPTDGPKPVYAAVLDNYLVVARTKAALLRVSDVRAGRAPALSSRADYRDARAGLPADANALVFVSPGAAKNLPAGSSGVSVALKGAGWFASSVTLRADGVLWDARLPWKSEGSALRASMQAAGDVAPLDTGVLAHLPSGALGAFAVSQPGRYAEAARTGVVSAGGSGGNAIAQETARRTMNEGMTGFERATGLSVDRDILPNLNGNVVLAAYPRPAGIRGNDGTPPADGLIIFDDAHGANPAALAAKVRIAIERASDDRARFVRDGEGGATMWRLTEGEPDKGLILGDAKSGGVSIRFNENGLRVAPVGENAPRASVRVDDRGVSLTGDAGTVTVNENGGGATPSPGLLSASVGQGSGASDVFQIIEKTTQGKDRAVVFAEVGKSVLVSSSPLLLARAVEAYQRSGGGVPTLAADRLTPGAQIGLLVSPAAIRENFAPLWKDATRNVNGKSWTPNDFFALLGADQTSAAPVAVSARYDGGVLRASAFVPVDYEKSVALASARKK